MQREYHADVIIIGGSVGGCSAALAAARMEKTVILTEETLWIGGQLTNQAVPPDEHPWIEQFGCTRSYRQFRQGVRNYYRRHFPLSREVREEVYFNPGSGLVSRLCHEPRAALAVLTEMMAPYIHSGRILLLTRYRIARVESQGDRIHGVWVDNVDNGEQVCLTGAYYLDATECGDLLPLAGAEYVTGAESNRETGEPHGVEGDALPLDMQAVTWCFAMDYRKGENHIIEKPAQYDFWRDYHPAFWPDRLLSWVSPDPVSLKPVKRTLFRGDGLFPLWEYRRIIAADNFAEGLYVSDISLVNWPANDYWLGPLYEVPEEEARRHKEGARQLSLSLLYWMQTEAPRPDGGQGYPGLRLRKDVTGTGDGLAMYPYIRESRRMKAEFTVVEQHLSPDIRGDKGAQHFHDSVGIGYYRIDLHPSTGNRNYIDIASLPFQIPLGSLIPIRMENLLPACKNIGVTHITNGCYRLHPVEWNVGEAAGALAAYCLEHGLLPRQVRNNPHDLEDFQALLSRQGLELSWPRVP